ncbi:MAG: hypothetical protein ACOCX0_03155 [Bacteroidota bacterium]
MKKWITITGVVVVLLGLYQGGRYLLDYNDLTSYGKGYVWGSALIVLSGILLIMFGVKKKKTNP